MSNFYNQASWVLVPSGIEEDIVFAQKPISGLGDLSFTRASDATYTDSTGVVRRSPYNLFTQSVWTGGGLNVAPTGWTQSNTTGNFEPITAINGSVSYRFYGTSARRFLFQSLNVVSGQELRISVFVNSVAISTSLSGVFQVTGVTATNLKFYVNNVEVDGSTNITQNTRIALSFTVTSTGSATLRVGGGSAGAATYDYVISQPQLVEGTSALDYFPTTNRQDVPRIDFRNADGTLSSCGRLLLEPQRTNSIRNSSMVGAVAGTPGTLPTNWSVGSGGLTRTITAIGTENGIPYIEARFSGTASSSSAQFTFETVTGISASAAQSWTESVYVRYVSGTANSAILAWDEYTSGSVYLTSKASTALTIGSTLSRVSLTATTSTNCAFVQPFIRFSLTSGTAYDFTIRIAAPQMELGAYATTWVPTTTAAVTRLADTASKTGVSSLIGQTQGTIFVEFINDGNSNTTIDRIFSLSDGTTNNRMYLARLNTNRGYFVSVASGTQTVDLTSSTTLPIGIVKIAVAYNTNDVVIYLNGTQVGSDTTATTPTTSNIYLGQENLGATNNLWKPYSQAALFPTRLTNAQLAQLTTL